MARRKKGRAIHGWVIVDKPAGIGSTQVVGKVRWAFDAQKAGHAGTLDPDATGVLAVALGEATKTVPFVTDALKCYRFRVTWGAETSTDDASGTVTQTSDVRPDAVAVETALPAFRGQIEQIPPQVSAVKVEGERAYDLAREGVEMDLAPRPLWVEEMSVLSSDADGVELRMICGKGGYVRSVARDLGRALGCLGHVAWLRREWSGPFDASQGLSLPELERMARTEELDAHLHPLEMALSEMPALPVTEMAATRLRHGNPAEVLTGAEFGETCWASREGRAVAVGTYRAGQLQPSKVFQT